MTSKKFQANIVSANKPKTKNKEANNATVKLWSRLLSTSHRDGSTTRSGLCVQNITMD